MANLNCLVHDIKDMKEWTYRIDGCDKYFMFKGNIYPYIDDPNVYPNCTDRKKLPDPVESVFDLRFDDIDEAKSFFETFDYFNRFNENVLYLDRSMDSEHHFPDDFSEKVLTKETGDLPDAIVLVRKNKNSEYVAIPCDTASVYAEDDDKKEATQLRADVSTKITVCDGVVAYRSEDGSKIILEGYEYDEISRNWTEVTTTRHIADVSHISRISDFNYFSTDDYLKMLTFLAQCNTTNGVITYEEYKNVNHASNASEYIDLVIYDANGHNYCAIIYREDSSDCPVTILEPNIYERIDSIKKMFNQ